MTYNDLCAEVAALGFEDTVEKKDNLLFSARRALGMIFTERPIYKSVAFYQNPLSPCKVFKDFAHDGGAPIRISFTAKAYSFKTAGIGSYLISDESGERRFDFTCEDTDHRGFLYGEGYIEFSGGYFYSVYGIAFFDKISGPLAALIPTLSEKQEYNARDVAKDFMSPCSLPLGNGGVPIKGAEACGGKIIIPTEYEGRVVLSYKAAPQRLTGEAGEEIILPDGTEHLFALLVAAYVWLDEDAEKAQYYMSLYRDALSAVRFYDRSVINNAYHETLGWA
ncbi:MAG: hypothetical protein J6V09_03280 [Clostridia bacterium]|nr:hypothetical protein [Clostridia bacterium]